MRILVTGAGRGGTYLLKAAVEAFGRVGFGKGEDRSFFKRRISKNYGGKVTTENRDVTCAKIIAKAHEYPDLRILFSSRHPVDILMSRLWRGQSLARENIERAIKAITFFYKVYTGLNEQIPPKVHCVKMADLILIPRESIDGIAEFLGWPTSKLVYNFVTFTNHERHLERYGQELDVSQINNHKRWFTAYDSFFENEKLLKDEAFNRLAMIIKNLGYKDV